MITFKLSSVKYQVMLEHIGRTWEHEQYNNNPCDMHKRLAECLIRWMED